MAKFDLIVIGGGIVGLASAYRILERHPRLRVAVLEKEEKLAQHQTGHNSGVLHSGLYYRPGSKRARDCVEGRTRLIEFAREHGIEHDVCGKIVVATDSSELPALERIFQNGSANGVDGIRKIGPEEIREREPHCRGVEAILVPSTGIIDFVAVAGKLAGLIRERWGGEVRTGCEARAILRRAGGFAVETSRGEVEAGNVVACAGLQCDRLARNAGSDPGMRVVGFRGDYYELSPESRHKVRHLIYPVPDTRFPFLGVHFTRMVGGAVECGPNAVFTFKREGYGKTDFSLRDSWDALTYPGIWKMFARHWKYGWGEYRRAFSKRLFLESLRKMVPDLTFEDIEPGRAGVRAVALAPDGSIIDDFKIVGSAGIIHVLNAPSPAATACLSIGSEVEAMARAAFGWAG